jgi:CubicO group peptidase (beta-lactamase class C family)
MNKNLFKILICCLAFINNTVLAQAAASAAVQTATICTADVDQIVNEALDAFPVPGVAIGITVNGDVILAKGYGFRNLEQTLPVTEHTLFAIGSCSKAFTTLMLGQLVDEGKISWDDTVISHIPEFRLMNEYATHHTTIRDLVAHRTGLARHDLLWFNPAFTRSDLIRCLPYLEPACQLREKFHYNNLMYTVAGLVIERVTGQTWEEALSSRIFTPLAMLESNDSVKKSQKSDNFSLPYMQVDGENRPVPFRDLTAAAPAGAINSTVSDMLKWIQLQLACDPKAVCKDTLQEMHTIQMPMVASATPEDEVYNFGYGLGWCVGFYRGNYYLHHGGGVDGFISQVSLLPQQKIGVVVLTNSSSDGMFAVSSITNGIIDRLLGKADVDWIEKSKIQREQIKQALKEPSEENGTNASLIRPLDDYVGYYEHPAYGSIQVKQEGDRLAACYGEVTIALSHKCYDIFNGKILEPLFGDQNRMKVAFSDDSSGEICELSVPLEMAVKPIVFQKKADPELFTATYLQQFVGKFGEDPLVIEVILKGGKAFFMQNGSESELIPVKKDKFSLKGLPGYYLEFKRNDSGSIRELVVVFPRGSLTLPVKP